MTFLPILAWPLLTFVVIAGLAAVWWNPADRMVPGESRGTHWRLTAAVLLLAAAALRPAVPGDEVAGSAANLNVYYVVDTTSSIIAEDYGYEQPRLDGVAADIAAITRALPGARYSVVTFDAVTRVRLPLTTDTTALEVALTTLLPETPEYSQGSSVTAAGDRLATLLEQAESRHPDRGRIVFYLGDGEQTAAAPPAPFALRPGLIQGGAVLGYGTAQGGRMKANRTRLASGSGYLQDPATREDARSVIDERQLREIGRQLGLAYHHRSSGESIDPVVESIDPAAFGMSESIEQEKVRARREFYWPLLLGVAGIGAWEIGAGVAALRLSRRRGGPAA